mmetsp:Transcript_29959/g.39971  ORF Transcript_29959/g.39971 Transcript_29959/m.39971 type:complete len:129 (-) Transcript_29959:85-471(-)
MSTLFLLFLVSYEFISDTDVKAQSVLIVSLTSRTSFAFASPNLYSALVFGANASAADRFLLRIHCEDEEISEDAGIVKYMLLPGTLTKDWFGFTEPIPVFGIKSDLKEFLTEVGTGNRDFLLLISPRR